MSYATPQTVEGHATTVAYRAIHPLATMSIACAALSIVAVFGWIFSLIPLAGVVCGWAALRGIRAHREAYTGRRIALTGIVASIVVGAFSTSVYAVTSLREVPSGYTAITFADLVPDPGIQGDEVTSRRAQELVGQKVFLRGFIYPGAQSQDLKEFVLVPSESHCSICLSQLRDWDLVFVKLAGDLKTDYKSRMTGVGGVLKIDPSQAGNPYGGCVYSIEADYVR